MLTLLRLPAVLLAGPDVDSRGERQMSDFSDTDKIAQRLTSSTKKLHDMASAVGSAKQVREFVGELRRNALSAEVVKFLKEGDSSAAAEHKARASEAYNQR